MSDNKALADRLLALAEDPRDYTSPYVARIAAEAAAALTPPQADKARGEVYCYPAWVHGECLEVLRNVDTQFRATGQVSARIERLINLLAGITPQPQGDASRHHDDEAVDLFAAAMKKKLAEARAKGRGGWDGSEDLQQRLSDMLRDHVAKGDPRDVANFACFLWNRGERITPEQPQGDGFTAADMMDARAEERARLSTPQVSGGGEALAVAAAMLRIAPTCESDWDEQLREWASRLSSTPQARPSCGTCGGRIRPDAMTGTACDCTPQARPSDDALWDQAIRERDEAEDALGRMFQAVTGRPAEWSSAWHYDDAIEEVEEHVAGLQQARPDGWESLRDWSQRMAVMEAGQEVRAGSFGIEDRPAPAPDVALAKRVSDFADRLASDRTYSGDVVEDLRAIVDHFTAANQQGATNGQE